MTTLTLCLRPTAGEPRKIVKYTLTETRTVVAVAARHAIDRVELDPADGETPAVWIEVATDRARPVHLRLELVAPGGRGPVGGHLLGTVNCPGGELEVYGTYVGPVSDEN